MGMTTEIIQRERKTTILGINRVAEKTTIAEVARIYEECEIVLIKKIRSKHYATANFLIEFANAEECEKAKSLQETVNLGSEEVAPFFAPSDALQQHRTVVSDNKLYVKYPKGVERENVKDLLKDFKLVEPTNDGNFLFIVCKDQSEQFDLSRSLMEKRLMESLLMFLLLSIKLGRIKIRQGKLIK